MRIRPPLTIIATTYAPAGDAGTLREAALYQAARTWAERLHYAGPRRLHVADDGSEIPGYPRLHLHTRPSGHLECTYSRQERGGVGASLNAGFRAAFVNGPLALYVVDDWELLEDFDVTLWADLLMENEEVGCVRLGPPHPGIAGVVEMFGLEGRWGEPTVPDRGGWFLRLAPGAGGFCFGHRPALYHKRFIERFGWFDEGVSALECERLYNERYAAAGQITRRWRAPEVVLALPHPWHHIDSVELADVQPGVRA